MTEQNEKRCRCGHREYGFMEPKFSDPGAYFVLQLTIRLWFTMIGAVYFFVWIIAILGNGNNISAIVAIASVIGSVIVLGLMYFLASGFAWWLTRNGRKIQKRADRRDI